MLRLGVYLVKLANHVSNYGIRKRQQPYTRIPCTVRILSNVCTKVMKYQIEMGYPICINTEKYNHDVIVQCTSALGKRRHIVVLIGFRDSQLIEGGGVFLFANSHGIEWGHNGFGELSYTFADRYIHEAVACQPYSPM